MFHISDHHYRPDPYNLAILPAVQLVLIDIVATEPIKNLVHLLEPRIVE